MVRVTDTSRAPRRAHPARRPRRGPALGPGILALAILCLAAAGPAAAAEDARELVAEHAVETGGPGLPGGTTPDGYRELAATQALSGRSWTAPALADGRLFVRNGEEIASFDLVGRAGQDVERRAGP